ncbi:MAG: hypothetical protein AAFV54_03955 [Pseudomonadota bacterium]
MNKQPRRRFTPEFKEQAVAAELAELRRENRRLKEEVEVMRKASAFFAQWAAKQ